MFAGSKQRADGRAVTISTPAVSTITQPRSSSTVSRSAARPTEPKGVNSVASRLAGPPRRGHRRPPQQVGVPGVARVLFQLVEQPTQVRVLTVRCRRVHILVETATVKRGGEALGPVSLRCRTVRTTQPVSRPGHRAFPPSLSAFSSEAGSVGQSGSSPASYQELASSSTAPSRRGSAPRTLRVFRGPPHPDRQPSSGRSTAGG